MMGEKKAGPTTTSDQLHANDAIVSEPPTQEQFDRAKFLAELMGYSLHKVVYRGSRLSPANQLFPHPRKAARTMYVLRNFGSGWNYSTWHEVEARINSISSGF